MIQNVLLNTPDTWAVQLFVHPQWWKKEILELHRGMHQLLQHPRILVTDLPHTYWNYKPKQITMDPWFWNQLVADRVFLFSGNGVLCAHSIASWSQFDHIDYMGGAPWKYHGGMGGDGSTHSLRNRHVVLQAIPHYELNDDRPGSEHATLVKTLMKLNHETPGRFRLAFPNETLLFGGATLIMGDNQTLHDDFQDRGPPRLLSGIQANLPWKIRDALFGLCPEWKLIFPSLHDPNCFGANPNAEACASTICALQPNRPKQGC